VFIAQLVPIVKNNMSDELEQSFKFYF